MVVSGPVAEHDPYGNLTQVLPDVRDRERLAEAQWKSDIEWTMSQAKSRRVIARVLEWTGWDKKAPSVAAEGARGVGVALVTELRRHSLDAFLLLQQETHDGHN